MSHQMLLFRALVASTVLVTAVAASAQAPASQDLVGTWTISITSPQGTHPTTFVIKEEAGRLAGSVSGAMGVHPLTVATSDAGVTMSFTVDYQGQPLPVVLTGKLADGALKGAVDYGNGSATGDFEGKKGTPDAGAGAAASVSPTVSGTWDITSDGGSGWSLELTQEGATVSGALKNASQGLSMPVTGTLENGALRLTVGGDTSGTITGTYDGTAFKGSFEVGGSAGSWSATRKP